MNIFEPSFCSHEVKFLRQILCFDKHSTDLNWTFFFADQTNVKVHLHAA